MDHEPGNGCDRRVGVDLARVNVDADASRLPSFACPGTRDHQCSEAVHGATTHARASQPAGSGSAPAPGWPRARARPHGPPNESSELRRAFPDRIPDSGRCPSPTPRRKLSQELSASSISRGHSPSWNSRWIRAMLSSPVRQRSTTAFVANSVCWDVTLTRLPGAGFMEV